MNHNESRMWRQARAMNQKLFPQFESLKQGRLSKVFDLYRDYTQAIKDTVEVLCAKPVKSIVYTTLLSTSVYCNFYNPDYEHYRESVLAASNKHSLISDLIRNRESASEIKTLMKYIAEERVKHYNFGVFSLVMVDEHSTYNDIYEKHCDNIQQRWIYLDEWKRRIKDIGFMDRWYFLEDTMCDYDINEEEFK